MKPSTAVALVFLAFVLFAVLLIGMFRYQIIIMDEIFTSASIG